MGYEYFEVTAEVGIRAWGDTLERAFAEAARALFELMVNTQSVRPQRSVNISHSAETLELLVADWLNQLILARDRDGLVFSEFRTAIASRNSGFRLSGEARGEPLDRARHDPRIDVKAATYHGLKVHRRVDQSVEIECVLDI